MIIVLALVHAELGGLFPVSGGTSRFPHYAFGSLAGATFGWFAYIQAAAVAPIEVEAALQYASTYSFGKHWLKSNGTLSGSGILVAIVLMVLFTIFNLIGIHWLARINNAADDLEGPHPGPGHRRVVVDALPQRQLLGRWWLLRQGLLRSKTF